MCGIAGYIDFKKNTSVEVLHKMTDSMEHRGPDGAGYETFHLETAILGLGHRRLSIIDLTIGGHQPKSFEDNWITFNGEIYNFQKIKNELIEIGHSFKSDSDTEVILHAYQEWGLNCVEKFIGMFAIAIFDARNNNLHLIRDRAGVKPLFYYHKEDLFMFASELKAFHEHPSFRKILNRDAVAAFMQYGNVPTPHCIFENCWKIKPGHQLTINIGSGKTHESQYWNVYTTYNQSKWDISYGEAKEKTRELLRSAFEYRLVADVPIGVFLSGGYDSVSVTSILQDDRQSPLKTYTISVPDIGLNEAPFAKDIAKHLGTDHTEIECTSNDAIELIEELPYYFDEPYADSSAIPTTLVSKMAREHVTVALSADAGDEVFAGYNRYDYLLKYGRTIGKIPGALRKGFAGLMDTIPSEKIPVLRDKYNFHNRYEKMKSILKEPSDEKIMMSLSQQFTNRQIAEIMSHRAEWLDTFYESNELRKEFYSPLAYMMAIDYQTYLLDDILQKVDRSTMSVSLEGREPFLDHRIIEFASRLPDEYKYKDGVKKRILKDLVHDYVPKELMDRPKMGFAIPIANWLQNELRHLVEEFCSESRLKEHNLFDTENIQKLLNEFFNGKKEYDMKVWYLLMFQMWYDKWMRSS